MEESSGSEALFLSENFAQASARGKVQFEYPNQKSLRERPANIAEGYGRFYYTEGVQFYRITRGSLTELKDHLLSCYDLTYISKVFCDEGMLLLDTARKLLNGYSNYTLAQIKAEKNE